MEKNVHLSQLRTCDLTKPYIFISYSAMDHEMVWRDVLEFQQRGYNVWLDEKNLDKTKASWKEDALEAIARFNCYLVVFYVSRHSLVSRACLNEIEKVSAEDTISTHFGPVKFICIDVEPIRDIQAYGRTIFQEIRKSSDPPEKKEEQAKALSGFIMGIFNSSNERVRVHAKDEEGRKTEYYSDVLNSFPEDARIYPSRQIQTSESDGRTTGEGKTPAAGTKTPGAGAVGPQTSGTGTGTAGLGTAGPQTPGGGTRTAGAGSSGGSAPGAGISGKSPGGTLPLGEGEDVEWPQKNGSTIYGRKVRGVLQGPFRQVYPSGEIWEGTMKDGKIDGKLSYTGKDGSVMTGTWKCGKWVGSYTKTFVNGTVQTGEFVDGKIRGKIRTTNTKGDVIVKTWVNEWTGPAEMWYKGHRYLDEIYCRANLKKGKIDDDNAILQVTPSLKEPSGTSYRYEGPIHDGKLSGLGKLYKITKADGKPKRKAMTQGFWIPGVKNDRYKTGEQEKAEDDLMSALAYIER